MTSKRGWYSIGWLTLAFGIISYICAFSRSAGFWDYFWACPVTAVLLGVALLARNHLAITALAMLVFAPIWTVAATPTFALQLEQFHHLITIATLVVILFHAKEIWSLKGTLLGIASFWAYTGLTNNLSGGRINFPTGTGQEGIPYMSWWLAISLGVLSVVIFLWYEPIVARLRKIIR